MVTFGEKMVTKWYQKKAGHKKNNFFCNLCLFETINKKDFIRHLKTKKHDNKWYRSFNNHKKCVECEDCDYISCDFEEASLHFSEFSHKEKHKKKTQKNPSGETSGEKTTVLKKLHGENSKTEYEDNENDRFFCHDCGKSYKYKSGLSRHRKKCIPLKEASTIKCGENSSVIAKIITNDLSTVDTNVILMNAIIKATETNTRLCERIVELENSISTTNNVVNNNTINNINKQEFNINVFLNQECKNAMNLKDFVKNIKLNVDDINYTATNGYIKGITNIFIRNLEEMALNERPIHSIQDKSNHQFYIKDENKWERDDKSTKIDMTIDSVTKRQINKIKDWESQNPNWQHSDKGIEEYMKIVQTIMGGGSEDERKQNRELIKKELVNHVKIEGGIVQY